MNDRPPPARRLWAALELLDHQMRASDGGLCGKVDDLELREDDRTGALYVSTVLSGPGRLLGRFGRRRLGDWLIRFASDNSPGVDDPTRIPFEYVREIGAVVELSIDADRVGSALTERWFRDHVVAHIPGSRHEPE
jgi:sporulation protein YlmC with PRC-barrel domain